MDAFDDIRDHLRRDHEATLAELDALRAETDDHRCRFRLQKLRRAWVTHALAEESVVYRALEGAATTESGLRADERFVEHELADTLFDKLANGRPGSPEWRARLNVLRDLVSRHIASEQDQMFAQLAARLDCEALCDMGRQFHLAREKLAMLEEAKAA